MTMCARVLLVMDQQHRRAVSAGLRRCEIELTEAPDWSTARQILCSGPQFEMVIADVTLPDGTWCSIARDLRDVSINVRFLVCADRHDQLLFADVVTRGGYYAVVPPHQWKPLRQLIGPAREARA